MGHLTIANQNGLGSVMVFPLASNLPAGRWFWEVRFANGDVPGIGETARIGVVDATKSLDGDLGEGTESWAWCADGTKRTAGVSIPCGTGPSEKDDTFMIALDADGGSLWFGLNGAWFDGDPVSGESPSFFGLPNSVLPAVSSTRGGHGILVQIVPTDESEFRTQPPPGFRRFAPGTGEYLPRPSVFGATPAAPIGSPIRRLIEAVVDITCAARIADLEARGAQFRKIAKEYLEKGNLLLAEKLVLQSLDCDPSDLEARDMAAWFPITRDSSYQLPDATDPVAERLFDFVYIPTEKCGTGAHVALLAVHPGATVPPTYEIGRAMDLNCEQDLLARYRVLTFARRPELKAGLVPDSHISGARQQPSGVVTGPEYAERLSRIVRRDGFFHAVRDPFRIVRSSYNSTVVQYLCGNYSFSFSNPRTPFSDSPRDLGSIRALPPTGDAPKVDPERLKDFFDFHIWMPRHYSIGKAHAEYFDAWQVIDLDRAAKNKNGRMAETYRALGLREDHKHLFDEFPHRDILHFAMLRNGMRLRIYGANIMVYLGRAVQTACYNTDDLVEVCWAEPDPACREIGLDQTLCLATPTPKWRALSEDTKKQIVQWPKLEGFFRNVFIPCWVDEYRHWREALRPYLIDEIDDAMRKRMWVGVREETTAFLEVHPEVAESWPDVADML